jgi:Putative metal-binding motif/SprB repeat/Secretion system C-terminal sorting domain
MRKFLFILPFLLSVCTALAQIPNLKVVWPRPGVANRMRLVWDPVASVAEYQVRYKTGVGAYGAWISAGTATTFTHPDNFTANADEHTFQVRVRVGVVWVDTSDERSNSFAVVWPVSSDANCTLEGIDVLNGFNQPIRVGATNYFHEGMDIHGTDNIASECVKAPVGGVVLSKGGTGNNVAVEITVWKNNREEILQFNHLSDALDTGYVVGSSVKPGQSLGTIKSGIWTTGSSHTHCHYYRNNDYALTMDPHTFWEDNAYRDPRGKSVRVTNTDNTADSLRFRFGPDDNGYFIKDTICREVDIVAEINDPQSTDAPWAAPKSITYYVQKFDGAAWVDVIKSAGTPYKLYDSANGYLDLPYLTAAGVSTQTTWQAISDRQDTLMSTSPTTPSDYGKNPALTNNGWQQWWTFQVTNAKGTNGQVSNLDQNQCWATDARTGTPNDNGYAAGYNRARCIEEARFKDAKYRVSIGMSDWRATAPDYKRELYVDNFLPYVKECKMDGGEFHYLRNWTWAGSSLTINANTEQDSVCGQVDIALKFSESMKEVKVSVPSIGYTETKTTGEAGSNNENWKFAIPSSVIATNQNSGPHKLVIEGKDLNGNKVMGFPGEASFAGASIPKHQHDNTWLPAATLTQDTIHKFFIKTVPIQVTFDVDSLKCYDSTDGQITINAEGGKTPYKYSKDGGTTWQGSNVFTGLKGGSYTIHVMDDDSCKVSKDTIISTPPKLNLSVSGGGIIPYCIQDGPPTITLSASASGGTPLDAPPFYNYSWPGGSLSVSGSGTYTCNVTDKNGCTAKATVIVVFIPILCSRDPNDIVGPIGYGDPKWVSVNDNLPYMIRFENDPEFATAPAQRVVIEHYPDEDLNLFSARLSDFGFANQIFTVPSNTTFYSQQLDLVDSLGIRVDVTAGIDVSNNKLFWIFESIDPATGLPPTDPLLGLLPINDSLIHNGEGFVNFTIKPKTTSITGDSIHAIASIVFDDNDTIVTPEIANVIDAFPPVSELDNLPATTDSTTFSISWSAQDDIGGCGVRDYTIYVSTNGGAFSLYQNGITDTSAMFTGQIGNSYSFFSIATDNVGNMEALKTVGGDTITIDGALDLDGDGYSANVDCNDNIAAINPGATEACNDLDDNCDGIVDNVMVCPVPANLTNVVTGTSALLSWGNIACAEIFSVRHRQKLTATTYGAWSVWTNTTTNSLTITGLLLNTNYQWAVRAICPGNNSSTTITKLFSTTCTPITYYPDTDNDGYGNAASSQSACSQPAGFVANATDCNDAVATIYPGATELCNGLDDNCDLAVADNELDSDGDTYMVCEGDCNDNNASINPAATEACNDLDDNCNGIVDNVATCPAPTSLTNIVSGSTALLGWANIACADSFSLRYRQKLTATTYGVWSAWQHTTSNSLTITGLLLNANYQWAVKATCPSNNPSTSATKLFSTTCSPITYYADTDNDGYGNAASSQSACSQPAGFVANATDCNDAVATIYPGATELCNGLDDNCDLAVADNELDSDGDTYMVCEGDCNDNNASINPAATEACNDLDDNCNGIVDNVATCPAPTSLTNIVSGSTALLGWANIACADSFSLRYRQKLTATTYGVWSAWQHTTSNSLTITGLLLNANYQWAVKATCPSNNPSTSATKLFSTTCSPITYYADTDNDGYGNAASSQSACAQPPGYVTNNTDCNDAVATIYPGATELCNGFDDNCDLAVPDNELDTDGDTYMVCEGDCNDNNAAIKPAATEACNDLDDNCDGIIDNVTTCPAPTALTNVVSGTSALLGWANIACADSFSLRYRQKLTATTYGVWSAWQHTTSNSLTITGLLLNANYQWAVKANCPANVASTTATKLFSTTCVLTTYYIDTDGDGFGNAASSQSACAQPVGFVANSTDCNDNNNLISPVAIETCNGLDDNCDAIVPANELDTDGDTYMVCEGDCNDNNAAIKPAATEACNDLDDNCDGIVDNVATCPAPTALANMTIGSTALLGWANIACADAYSVRYSQKLNATTYGPWSSWTNVNTNSHTLTGLLSNTTYRWNVRTVCVNNQSLFSAKEFTTCVAVNYYLDADLDGFGNAQSLQVACNIPPVGYVANSTDCDDSNAAINLNASEICDLKDNDCDLLIDEGFVTNWVFADTDGDGFGAPNTYINTCLTIGYAANCNDCDDTNPAIFMNAIEVSNALDDDCDGIIDNVCGNVLNTRIIHQSTTSVVIDWDPINDAGAYNLQYRLAGTATFGPTPPLASFNSYTELTGLTPNATYEYRIRTKCGSTFTPYSAVKSFTTLSNQTLCNKPTLGGANPISIYTSKIWWNFEPNNLGYHVRVRDQNVNPPLWINKYSAANAPNIGFAGLTSGSTYLYQIRANCASVWTGFSTIGSFVMPTSTLDCTTDLPTALIQFDNESQENDVSQYPSLHEINDKGVFLFPNPTDGVLNIESVNLAMQKGTLYDMTNRTMASWPVEGQHAKLDLSAYPTGVYLLRIELIDGSLVTMQLLKK